LLCYPLISSNYYLFSLLCLSHSRQTISVWTDSSGSTWCTQTMGLANAGSGSADGAGCEMVSSGRTSLSGVTDAPASTTVQPIDSRATETPKMTSTVTEYMPSMKLRSTDEPEATESPMTSMDDNEDDGFSRWKYFNGKHRHWHYFTAREQ
jgi:hypothetical protein